MIRQSLSLFLLACLALCFASSCRKPLDTLRLHGRKPVEDPWRAPVIREKEVDISKLSDAEILQKVEEVAVLPFINQSGSARNTLNDQDTLRMAEQFSNHLVGGHTFKTVMFPRQALSALEKTNLSTMRSDDLKEIGNELNVDALVFGVIKQYDMYHPANLTISMKFYLTRLGRFATSEEISDLAHSGVPKLTYNPTFFKQLWDTSCHYDASNRRFADILKHYAKSHDLEFSGWSNQRNVRTKRDFLNLLSYDLARSLYRNKNPVKKKVYSKNKGRGKVQKHRIPDGYFPR